MHVILDHLAAVIITSVILLVLAVVQVRGTQSATDATVNHFVYTEGINMNQYLERDIENMLTQAQSTTVFTNGRLLGAGAPFDCTLNNPTGDLTQSFTFPTVNPDSTVTANPDSLYGIQVTYRLQTLADSIMVPIDGVLQQRELFQLERVVNGIVTGSSKGYVTHFMVEVASAFVPGFPTRNGLCPPDMSKIRFEYKLATEGVEFLTTDQRNTGQLNASRFGATVNLTNWE